MKIATTMTPPTTHAPPANAQAVVTYLDDAITRAQTESAQARKDLEALREEYGKKLADMQAHMQRVVWLVDYLKRENEAAKQRLYAEREAAMRTLPNVLPG